jgi:hypothetical protein
MGRFDSLKDNPFNSNNEKSNKKRNNRKDNKKKDIPDRFKMEKTEPKLDKNKYDRKDKKEEVIEKKEQVEEKKVEIEKPKEESEWIKRIKKTEEVSKPLTDVNNPMYWDGPIWKGPVYIKGNKIGDKWKKYIENANKISSTIIIPNINTKWSRDGINWYNSYDETFSPEHLQAIENYKWQKEMEKFAQRTIELHEKRREESERNYWETGEIDDFMWAEIENRKYEEYCAKLEKEWEEADRLAREEEVEREEEEYLEDEDDD